MSTVICGNVNCPNRKGEFCGLDFVSINNFAQCLVFYSKSGNPLELPLWDRNKVEPFKAEVVGLAEEEKIKS